MQKTKVVAAIITLTFLVAPTVALAGGNIGGSQNKMVNTYHCKSGHVVKNPKACKENGGRR